MSKKLFLLASFMMLPLMESANAQYCECWDVSHRDAEYCVGVVHPYSGSQGECNKFCVLYVHHHYNSYGEGALVTKPSDSCKNVEPIVVSNQNKKKK